MSDRKHPHEEIAAIQERIDALEEENSRLRLLMDNAKVIEREHAFLDRIAELEKWKRDKQNTSLLLEHIAELEEVAEAAMKVRFLHHELKDALRAAGYLGEGK
jgi:hypothetical protein